MPVTPATYKPKDRRKKAVVKRVTLSPEALKANEATIRDRDARDRAHTQFLPEELKGKK